MKSSRVKVENDKLSYEARRIKELRLTKGLDQGQIARQAGITQPNLSKIELGKQDPRLSTLKNLAKVLNTTISDLLGETKDSIVLARVAEDHGRALYEAQRQKWTKERVRKYCIDRINAMADKGAWGSLDAVAHLLDVLAKERKEDQ